MGRRRCCCGCVQFLDEFERPSNPDNLGPQWEIVDGKVGDWQIVNGVSGRAVSADGMAIFIPTLPDVQGSMFVHVDLFEPDYDDIFDVILSYKDENNFLFARFQSPAEGAPEYWRQGVGKVSGGVEGEIYWDDQELTLGCGSLQQAFMWGATRTVVIHYDRAVLEISGTSIGWTHYGLWHCHDSFGSANNPTNRAGLRHGGGPRDIAFDNFFISEHYRTNPTCPDGGCRCLWDKCFPDEFSLQLTLISGEPCEEVPEYLQATLTRLHASQSIWRTPRLVPCLGSVQEDSYRQFFLECLGFDRTGAMLFRLWLANGIYDYTPEVCDKDISEGDGVYWITWDSVSQVCEPFALTFRDETANSRTFSECCYDPYEPGAPDDPWVYEAVITEVAE